MGADWQKFQLKVPVKDVLKDVRQVLETLLVYLEVLKAILETIKKFLIDFGNPIRALVEALIRLINDLIQSLRQTGLYGYFDVPDPSDFNFVRNLGGIDAFLGRFRGSLYDTRDPWRPQPVPFFNSSGFVMLVIDSETVPRLIRYIIMLLRFFGKEWQAPRYAAPANAKVLPIGDSGDPILAVAKVFSSNVTALAVEWTLPSVQKSPDPGFSDLVMETVAEFIPPKFIIARSSQPVNPEITVDQLTDPSAVGIVTYQRDTAFQVSGKPGKTVKLKDRLRDEYGDMVTKFENYYVIDESSPTFWAGQLGKYRWIDSDIEKDKTYYYQVRVFSGDIDWDDQANRLRFTAPAFTPNNPNTFQWPGSGVVMGKASPVLTGRVVDLPDFDVLENLYRVFLTAFSFDFHLPIPMVPQTNGPAIPFFTYGQDGLPTGTTPSYAVGWQSLTDVAGPIQWLDAVPLVGKPAAQLVAADTVTGQPSEMPWTTVSVQYNAARLSNLVGSAMLEAGSGVINGFKDLMLGPLPAGAFPTKGTLEQADNMSKVVFAMTEGLDEATTRSPDVVPPVPLATVSTYEEAFFDARLRLNLLRVVQYIRSFTLGGVPPDWVSIALLRDIIPWSAQIIYDILDKIQALLDAFSGVMQEIRDFIDLLIQKIEALEKFIAFLISILNFIDSLELDFYMLKSGKMDGVGVEGWLDVLASAGGNKPVPNPNAYTAGVVFAYVGPPTVAKIQDALDLIF